MLGPRRPIVVGEVFSRLTVIGEAPPKLKQKGFKIYRVLVRCECGNERIVYESKLRYGSTRSCGCISHELVVTRNKQSATHKHTGTRTYKRWLGMKARCYKPQTNGFHNYGGRGIRVCKRWKYDFEAFLEDLGECPEGYTLERRNVNGNYEPKNCYWATSADQHRNRRTNKFVVLLDERLTIAEASRKLNISQSTISHWAKRNNKTYQEACDHIAKSKEIQ